MRVSLLTAHTRRVLQRRPILRLIEKSSGDKLLDTIGCQAGLQSSFDKGGLMYRRTSIKRRWSAVFLTLVLAQTGAAGPQEQNKEEWKKDNSFGFSVSVAMNALVNPDAISHRDIYLFIRCEDFTLDNVKKVFTGLAGQYRSPVDLWIYAYSNEAAVLQAVGSSRGCCIHFASTPEGHRASRNYELLTRPSKAGLFRAKYVRSSFDGREQMEYTPSREQDHSQMINLNDPVIHYTGNLSSDLVLAIENDDEPAALRLLDSGADANDKGRYGETLLMKAAERGQLGVVKKLLEKEARLNAKSDYGLTALMSAAMDGSVDTVEELIRADADVNAQFAGGTPLTLAALHGHAGVVTALLANGANVEAKNEFGETALMCAAIGSFPEIVRALAQSGADLDARDPNGRTALTLVCIMLTRHDPETMRTLLDLGANFRATDRLGNTALMLAAKSHVSEAVEILANYDVKRTAIEPSKAALARNPRDEDAYRVLRAVYLALGRFEDAIEISKRAVAALPDNGQPYYLLGEAYLTAGDGDNARKVYELILKKAQEGSSEGNASMFEGWASALREAMMR
jgi:ankyrin repeat protein